MLPENDDVNAVNAAILKIYQGRFYTYLVADKVTELPLLPFLKGAARLVMG